MAAARLLPKRPFVAPFSVVGQVEGRSVDMDETALAVGALAASVAR